jgi:hypothetical protein
MGEEATQTLQVFDNPDPMTQHQQGIERTTSELEDVGATHVRYSTLHHDLDRVAADVDRGDRPSAGQQDEAVKPGTCAYIEHVAPAAFERRDLDRGEFQSFAKEVARRQGNLVPIITPDDEPSRDLAVEVSAQSAAMWGHGMRIHGRYAAIRASVVAPR